MIDFGDIKEIWKNEIEVYFDHRYLNETLTTDEYDSRKYGGLDIRKNGRISSK